MTDIKRKMPTPATPKMDPFGISAGRVRARIDELQMDAIWQTAQEHWPKISRDKTYLQFTEMLFVDCLVLKEEMPDEQTSWAGTILRVADLIGEDTGLSFDEQIELLNASSDFEMKRIALKPVGDFMMGYGPRADLLAVQEAQ